MAHELFILRRAQKELSQLPAGVYERLLQAIRALAQVPRPQGCLKLSAREGWRIKVGDYRVVYEVDDERRVITILHIGHRRDIYSR